MSADRGSEKSAIETPATGLGARVGRDLWPRVVSGVVIASCATVAIVAGSWLWALLVGGAVGIAGWEWSRIVRGSKLDAAPDAAMVTHITFVVVAVVLAGAGYYKSAATVVLAGGCLMLILTARNQPVLSAVGVLATGLPGVALVWLRADPALGIVAVLYVVSAVAMTDIGAYFSGRLIGGPKLWPRVSPNKTWAGLGGGMIAAALVGAIVANTVSGAATSHLMLLGALLAVVAQAGDLAESALKRRFGVKDASQLIPGHGGVMDRIDGLATASLLAAVWGLCFNIAAPAQAVLTW